MSYDKTAKIIIIGDTYSGKSALLESIVNNKFDPQQCCPTIGVEFNSTIVNVENIRVKALLWDTAGQESYRCLINGYYRGCSAAIIVFDVTNGQSFRNIDYWRKEIGRNNPGQPVVQVLVANKTDKPNRVIDKEMIEKYCSENDIEYFEASAKTHKNTRKLIYYVIKQIIDKNIKLKDPKINILRNESEVIPEPVSWCKCGL